MLTALMSVLATVLTLIIALPVSYDIAKIAKGRLQSSWFQLCLLQFLDLADGRVEMLHNDTAMMVGWSTLRCCSWWCRWSQT